MDFEIRNLDNRFQTSDFRQWPTDFDSDQTNAIGSLCFVELLENQSGHEIWTPYMYALTISDDKTSVRYPIHTNNAMCKYRRPKWRNELHTHWILLCNSLVCKWQNTYIYSRQSWIYFFVLRCCYGLIWSVDKKKTMVFLLNKKESKLFNTKINNRVGSKMTKSI